MEVKHFREKETKTKKCMIWIAKFTVKKERETYTHNVNVKKRKKENPPR